MTEQELNYACGVINQFCEGLEPHRRNFTIEDFRKAMTEKTNPLFEQAIANVNPETRAEVRRNMEFLDKACEWLEKYMESLGYIDEWCRNGEDAFRKAMIKED